jgi:hypothetical protein
MLCFRQPTAARMETAGTSAGGWRGIGTEMGVALCEVSNI